MLDVTRTRPRAWVSRLTEWLGSGRSSVLVGVLAMTTLLRLPYVWAPLSSDEGGFLLVAHQAATTEGSLYGNQWVDRPPGLIMVFRLADLMSEVLGDRVALRIVAMAMALTAVASAWFAGRVIGGSRGGIAAAVVLAAFTSTPVFSGPRLMTALPAVTGVTVSAALVLVATYGARSARIRAWCAFGAGAAAAIALLMKQNFADGFVFAAVLWVLMGRRGAKRLALFAAGAALPLLAVVAWGAAGPGLGALWEAT